MAGHWGNDDGCDIGFFEPRPKIKTEFWRKPIPTNKHDWLAFYDGDEPNDAGCMDHGEGATEAEAIADLTENYPR